MSMSILWISLLYVREFFAYIEYTDVSIYFTVCITMLQMLQYFFFLIKNKYRVGNLFLVLCFLLPLMLYNSATLATINIVMSVILLRKDHLNTVLVTILITMVFCVFIYVFLFYFNIINDEIWSMPKGVAHTLGFRNTNGPGRFLFDVTVVISILILNFFNRKLLFLHFLMFIANYYMYIYTLGRTPFYSLIIYYVLFIFFNFFLKRNSTYTLIKKISILTPVLLSIITIVAIKIYEHYPVLDVIFTTRFSKNSVFVNNLSIINFFIGYRLPAGEPMDSAYLALFFAGGVVSLCFFFIVVMKGIYKLHFNQAKKFSPFILCILFAGFTENMFSSFAVRSIVFYKILSDSYILSKSS